jgi:hypothetical protein
MVSLMTIPGFFIRGCRVLVVVLMLDSWVVIVGCLGHIGGFPPV